MTARRKELMDYTRILRNAAPQEFASFCQAFERYTDLMVTDLVNATGDLALVQGQARQCQNILGILEEIKNG
jgi:hypothetical protein